VNDSRSANTGPDKGAARLDRARRKTTADDYRIFRARLQDASLLAAIGAETFRRAFDGTTAEKDIEDYIRGHFSPARQRRELSIPEASAFIAAAACPVGYVQLIPDRKKSAGVIQLKRLYLLPELYGSGLADRLLARGLEECRRKRFVRVWLSCWEKNHRALAFYRRWGFVQTGRMAFPVGADRQQDILLSRVP
jgi:GNAT superfamily N-acetyltransferase